MVHQLEDHSAIGIDLWEFISTNFSQHKVRIVFTSAYFLQPAHICCWYTQSPQKVCLQIQKTENLLHLGFTHIFIPENTLLYFNHKNHQVFDFYKEFTELWCVKHTKAQEDKTCPLITATFAKALHTNTNLFISFLMILLYFSDLQT